MKSKPKSKVIINKLNKNITQKHGRHFKRKIGLKEKSDDEIVNSRGVITRGSGMAHIVDDYLIDLLHRNMEMQKYLKDATNKSSIIMICLNIALIIFTGVLVWLSLALIKKS